jgi:amino acid adenylation domain-containing protein/non-ribosomal peptide synthase protein (TIGR01720 family)
VSAVEHYELSNPQKRIWRTELLYERRDMANIGYLIELKGQYDLERLARAIKEVVKVNRGLQLRFTYADEDQGDLVQHLPDHEEVEVKIIEAADEGELYRKIEEMHRQQFAITARYLCAFVVFSINHERYGLFEKAHHLVADGISAVIVAREVIEAYHRSAAPAEKEFSYIDFLKDEQAYLEGEKYSKDREYWLARFADFGGEEITFALNKNKPNSLRVKRGSYRMPRPMIELLEAYEAGQRISHFVLFMAALSIYFNRFFFHEDMVIGMPVHNRSRKIFRDMAGMFVSTLPFRIKFEEKWSFNDLIASIKKGLWEDFKHQGYPYNHLANDLKDLNIDTSGLLNAQLIELPGGSEEEVVKRAFFSTTYNISQISIYLNQQRGRGMQELEVAVDYHEDIFAEREVDLFFKRLTVILEQAVREPEREISALSLLEEAEYRELIVELNDTAVAFPGEKTLCQLFEEQAAKNPENVALEYEGETVTYGELNGLTDKLAARLQAAGIVPDAIVGMLCERSIEAVVSILGILKAGGAYLPIDPAYPQDKKNYIVENSGLEVLVTARELEGQAGELYRDNRDTKHIVVDYHALEQETADREFKPPALNGENLAYVIYTSGTTGNPKGTLLRHRNVINYVCWGAGFYVKGEKVSFPLYTSLSFDLTVTSIFIPLISGNTIVIYRESQAGLLIERVVEDNRVDIVKLTPSHLKVVKELKCKESRIKSFIVGGEELKTDTAREIDDYFQGKVKIYNEYGPTETAVGCMIHQYDRERDRGVGVPIGKPSANVKIYILDKNRQPLPIGIVGEIYIGGAGVARGYLKNEALTAEKFVDNPFVPGEKMYRSGDLGRWNPDRVLEFYGRGDEQVKIRGYRIEPGEIEEQLLKIEDIKDAVVVMLEDRAGQKSLCAYLVPDGAAGAEETEGFDTAAIRKKLGQSLPDYMVPAFFVPLAQIPLTPNGKLDRKALPEPGDIVKTGSGVMPATEPERDIQKIWSAVLGFENVGMEDNFFELGGDSIKAVQIAARMHDRDLSVNARDILQHQTVQRLCANVDFQSHIRRYDQGLVEGDKGITPIEAWFLSRRFKNPHHYNQSVLLQLKRQVDIPLLEKTFETLVTHHDGLRLNYKPAENLFYFNNDLLKQPFKVETIDLSELPAAGRAAALEERGEAIKGGFDLADGLLVKAALFRDGEQPEKLLISAHHLVIDGLSWRILLEDLYRVYTALERGEAVLLSQKTASLNEWYDALFMVRHSGKLEKEKEYWDNTAGIDFRLPQDNQDVDWRLKNRGTEKVRLAEEETAFLLKEAHEAYKTDVQILVTAALVRTLRQRGGRQKLQVEMENHGRHLEEIDVSRTVGWFTALYPLGINREDRTIGDEIKTVKEAIRKIPNHGIGYGILKYMADSEEAEPPKGVDVNDNTGVRFNYLGQFDQEVDNPLFSYCDQSSGADVSPDNHMTAAVEINAMILKGILTVDIHYNRQAHKPGTMASFAEDYLKNLREILDHIKQEDNVHFTPSDFDTVDLSEEDLAALFE